MGTTIERAVAIVGVGAIMPDALNAETFWSNILNKRYSIIDVPPERWSADLYYDPDPTAPDKSYSKIGGWVRGFEFDWRRFKMPPKVVAAMDQGQQWAVTVAAEALTDYGYPKRPLNTERTAVILGTAMGGELHYITHSRIVFPEFAEALAEVSEFEQLPAELRQQIIEKWHERISDRLPPITEDSMPGELPNIVSGRVANLLNLRGPNFITDAACASSFAAIESAVQMLVEGKVDAVVSGGVDRNMSASTFVKFCKIGALSGKGTRPFGEGADGFVMGEGAAAFLLKRLEDAEAQGDNIYAVIRGIGGASDGKGKGITAPNPIGQQLAMQRAWQNAGLEPATATMIEAHGTSTRVGDVVEFESLQKVFGCASPGSIALGSVKSNIGHLKAGAGAAGLFKAAMSLHYKIIPATLNAEIPNPNICFKETSFYLNHQTREWTLNNGSPRRCGVSAYGFGGTNFHLVLEEYVPGMAEREKRLFAAADKTASPEHIQPESQAAKPTPPSPVRGILALCADSTAVLSEKLNDILRRVEEGFTPPTALPKAADIQASERLIIDFGSHDELLTRLQRAQKAMALDSLPAWQALQPQGIFRGSGQPTGKIAFLFPGQGSQYPNMGRELAKLFPSVRAVFDEADAIMEPILGRPLTSYIFVDPDDKQALNQAQFHLMQTEITQPAMLTLDIAMMQLLADFGFQPDMVMGHSLGEYAALIAAGIMPFAQALEAAAARGSEMSKVSVDDNGKMAAILAPLEVVQETLAEIDGYVVPANINSYSQCVIGGASSAVEEAVKLFEAKGYKSMVLPVSHAFHTAIVAPASEPLGRVLNRLSIKPPQLPLVANVTGNLYPTRVNEIKDLLQKQVASPVQWVKGLETLYNNGVRTFIEVGPKRALRGFANEVFKNKSDILALITNHPKTGAIPTFNQALCGLYAAGFGGIITSETMAPLMNMNRAETQRRKEIETELIMKSQNGATAAPYQIANQFPVQAAPAVQTANGRLPEDRNNPPLGSVIISGTGLGLPGAEKAVMDPENAMRILRGEQFVDLIPERFRRRMVDKHIMRLIKGEDGSGRFETIDAPEEVIKLAGRPGSFDLTEEYGVPAKLVEALDITTQFAMAAGLDALREAGIPLVMTYKKTTTGKYLPLEWKLPLALRDETGVIFASAFPGGDRFADEFSRYYRYQNRREQLEMLEDFRRYTADPNTLSEIGRRTAELREALEREPYEFDRRFLFRILAMGHSQFAQYVGARGPNTQVNSACASTAQAIAIAEDWIRSGRCRRVVVIAADDVTGDNLMEWVGAGFLAVGAVTTNDRLEEAALPFDRRRHGTIMGMGACALVVESEDAVQERGMRGIVELLASETNNSAFHGTRLDVEHIAQVMNNLITSAERRFGLNRYAIAPQTVFMSHETYTPARGGSAAAEVVALRETFGEAAQEIIVSNTKGFTGHPMGVGIEDVIAVKILEHGIVPPVPNFKEVDPDLGPLNLSRGGRYPVQYAIHLAAGFGSQISLTLTRRIPGGPNRVDNRQQYDRWLSDVSGYDRPETEIVKRVLRIKEQGNPPRVPIANAWQYGTGPMIRTQADGMAALPAYRPAPMPVPATMPEPQPAVVETRPQPVKIVRVEPVTPPQPVTAEATPLSEQSKVEPVPVTVEAPDSITAKVLAIVAEQTGYPEDMLDLDLDLEADLGIDTVKQAETFAAIRKEFDIPRREDLSLRDYNTLERVIGFVEEMRPDLKSAVLPAPVTPPVETLPIVEHMVAAPPQTTSNGADLVVSKVLAIVAEQTGYPEDMLDLDLDLEADLGIDTVKQAETFAAIRKEFDIPRREDLSLRDYNTLERVIGFVKEMRPDFFNGAAVAEQTAETSTVPAFAPAAPMTYTLAGADAMPRRIPVPTLRPVEPWYKPTGVTLDENSRVIVALDDSGVGQALCGRLEKLGTAVLTLDVSLPKEALDAQLKNWLSTGPIQGVYWLPALEPEPPLEEMTLESWRELTRQRVKNLFLTMQAVYGQVNGRDNFLVSATRLGGLHGYGPAPAESPLGGGVTGFTKAYKRERPQTLVKAVDFANSRKTAALADHLIWETLTDPGVIEVGYWQQDRYAIAFEEAPADYEEPGLTLDEHTVFVVTGAAGSITSAITADLAAASGGTFYLLDLVEAPNPADPNIALFRSDKEGLKQALIAKVKADGERPTPAIIERQIAAVERQDCALKAIEAVEAAGGTAHYHSLNLLDGAAVKAVIDEIREREGRIDILIHAGGIEISRSLADKDYGQFSLVFDIKADGFFNLLNAAAGLPIGATVVFSSVAGRFGNSGQTDYSAVNDLLCKLTSNLSHWRPDTRAIAIDWTAWAEIGMATRGSIPKIMEMAGIDMLPPTAGIPTVRRELVCSNAAREIVVGGALGILTEEWDESGGVDITQINAWLAGQEPSTLMLGEVKAFSLLDGVEIQTTFDPNEQPFLHDHAMDGTPLLPGVMGTETFAELAQAFAPGYRVSAVTNVQFHKAFKFYKMEPQTMVLNVTIRPLRSGELGAHTTLRSRRQLATSDRPQEKLHFSADVLLTAEPPEALTIPFTPPTAENMPFTTEAIYKIYFHGPAYKVLERVQVNEDKAIGLMAASLPPNTNPADVVALMAPRLIELCFQTAGVWDIYTNNTLALPLSIERVATYRQLNAVEGRLYGIVTAVADGASYNAQVVDEAGNVYVVLTGYRTVQLPGRVEIN
ncbi:MAG: SDR family NAD(P)-dependent oxidoreductase [Candidatus Promineifilaceae bacterium]